MAYFPWPEYLTVVSSVHLGPATSNCSSLSSQGSSVFPLKQPISYTWEFRGCEYSVVEFLCWDHSQDLIFQRQNIMQLKSAGRLRYLLCCGCHIVLRCINHQILPFYCLTWKKENQTRWQKPLNAEVWKHKVQFISPWKQPCPDFSWALSTMWR